MEIDLLPVAAYAGSQPHDQFDWLRLNSPVYRHREVDGPGFWALTRYDDVKGVGRDHERFSSSPTIMIADPSGAGRSLADGHTMMLMADPPLHTRMRRMVSREFTPRASEVLRPRIRQLAALIIDEVIEAGQCDLVTDIAGEMPSFVIAEVLGIALDEGRTLYRLTETLHSSAEVVSTEERHAAGLAMFEHAQRVYRHKIANPADDLATVIAHGVLDGRPVDEIDFYLWFMLLVDAGGDTTRNLVGGGLHTLFANQEQLELLRSDLDRYLPTAVEELLRWVSPVIYMRRTATVDTQLGDQAVAAGDKVVMYYGAANRDPEMFEHPHEFDITRDPNPHVAFGGGGPHYCLGASLARVEITELLREVLTRMPDLHLTGDASWMGSNFIFGPTRLPVAFTPAATV